MLKEDVIEITKKLVAFETVTPADLGCQAYLAGLLEEAGFEVFYQKYGEIENFFARIGSGAPHLCYGGHTDVVPPGPREKWTHPPFEPTIDDGVLYGRGVADMKGSVAAFAAAAIDYVREYGAPKNGSISLLITGDEEADAVDGTIKVLEWMEKNDHIPDVFLVGEPSNPDKLGQEIKVGRRGSLNGVLTVQGVQGHVAYPERSKNPMPLLVKMADVLNSHVFDEGTEFFAPTNLEMTSIDVGNTAVNVTPDSGAVRFNVRFNDTWTSETLDQELRRILDAVSTDYTLITRSGAEGFITEPNDFTDIVRTAVTEIAERTPEYTTTGGTSDARFTAQYAPTVEYGPINATIHQIDENLKIADLEDTAVIYRRVIELYLQQ